MKIDITLTIHYDVKNPTEAQRLDIKNCLYQGMNYLAGVGMLSPDWGPDIDTWDISQYNETWQREPEADCENI